MPDNIPFENNDEISRALPEQAGGTPIDNDAFAQAMRGQPAPAEDTDFSDIGSAAELEQHNGVELTHETFELISKLKTGAVRDINAQLDDAQILFTLSQKEDVADGGGVAKVVPLVAGIGWSKSRVSKYYLVAEQLIEPVGRDYVDDVIQRETESIKDFEILYLVAQTVKGGEGAMSPYEAMSSFYDLNRDQAREKLASVKKKPKKEKADDDTWGTFEERLPAETIVDLQEGLARVASMTGMSALRIWKAFAALLNEADDDNLGQIFRALDKGHAIHIRVLTPDEESGGEYSFADGSHIRDFIEAAMSGNADTFAALVKQERPAAEAPQTEDDVVEGEFKALPTGESDDNPLPADWPPYLPISYRGTPFETPLDVNVNDNPESPDVPSQDVWPAGITWEASRDRYRVRSLNKAGKRYLVCRTRNYLTACAALAQSQSEPEWKPDESWEPIFGDAADVRYKIANGAEEHSDDEE